MLGSPFKLSGLHEKSADLLAEAQMISQVPLCPPSFVLLDSFHLLPHGATARSECMEYKAVSDFVPIETMSLPRQLLWCILSGVTLSTSITRDEQGWLQAQTLRLDLIQLISAPLG